MLYALIQKGVVQNVIDADADFIKLLSKDWSHIEPIDASDDRLDPAPGWRFAKGQFMAPVPVAVAVPGIQDVATQSDAVTLVANSATKATQGNVPGAVPTHISVPALFDRFGAAKYTVLSSTSPLVRGFLLDVSVRLRQGVNLRDKGLLGTLLTIQKKGLAIDAKAIVDTPITPQELP